MQVETTYFYKAVIMLDLTKHDVVEGCIVSFQSQLYEVVLAMFDDNILNLLSLVSLSTKELLNLDVSSFGNDTVSILSSNNDFFAPVMVKDFFRPKLKEMMPIQFTSPATEMSNPYSSGVKIHHIWEQIKEMEQQRTSKDLMAKWMYSPHQKTTTFGEDSVETDFDSIKW